MFTCLCYKIIASVTVLSFPSVFRLFSCHRPSVGKTIYELMVEGACLRQRVFVGVGWPRASLMVTWRDCSAPFLSCPSPKPAFLSLLHPHQHFSLSLHPFHRSPTHTSSNPLPTHYSFILPHQQLPSPS